MKQTLTKKNKAFWALPKSEQRIAVAKDVIAQIKAKFYKPETGNYFSLDTLRKPVRDAPKKLDTLLAKLKKEKEVCTICGIGGCFASLVRIGNSVDAKKAFDVSDDYPIEQYDGINDGQMRPFLKKVFSSSQLTLIECAFETSTSHYNRENDTIYAKREKAAAFGDCFPEEKDRLIAIMENIIRNKGIFKV